MKEVLQAMGITIVEKPGYEADDLLGTIAGGWQKHRAWMSALFPVTVICFSWRQIR